MVFASSISSSLIGGMSVGGLTAGMTICIFVDGLGRISVTCSVVRGAGDKAGVASLVLGGRPLGIRSFGILFVP